MSAAVIQSSIAYIHHHAGGRNKQQQEAQLNVGHLGTTCQICMCCEQAAVCPFSSTIYTHTYSTLLYTYY